MIKIMKDFMAKTFAGPVQTVWLLTLMTINMVMPLFFYNRIEAQITLICMLVAFMAGMMIFKSQGYTRLLGLMHFTWIPLVIFLAGRLAQAPIRELFGIWMRTVIILNSISLTIDITDVIRYAAGDRKPLK